MIGVALAQVAIRDSVEVYAVVRPGTKRIDRLPNSPLIHRVYSELKNLRDVKEIPYGCDVLYHLAWDGTIKNARDDARIQANNIKYTMDAVELAETVGCRRFVFAGSQAEYGPVDGIIDENTKHAPVSSYGIAKYAAGSLSKKLCNEKNMEHVWGRIFSVYGPHENENTMLDYAIKCFKNGVIAHFSASTQMWNYLYEEDAGELFLRLGRDSVPEGTYLIANDENKPLKDYIRIVMDAFDNGAEAEFAPLNSSAVYGLNVDVKRTMDILKYSPCVRFDDGIRRMINLRVF